MQKPVEDIIDRNKPLWKQIENVTAVYTYGFSYGDVDIPYIRKIIESCPDCKNWYIEEYPGEEDIKKYIEIIKREGFKGIIGTFKIDE